MVQWKSKREKDPQTELSTKDSAPSSGPLDLMVRGVCYWRASLIGFGYETGQGKEMKDFIDFIWEDKAIFGVLAFLLLFLVGLFGVGLPMALAGAERNAEACHAKGGYVIKGGTCINKDSVIRLNP
jgi:hypothetical protein